MHFLKGRAWDETKDKSASQTTCMKRRVFQTQGLESAPETMYRMCQTQWYPHVIPSLGKPRQEGSLTSHQKWIGPKDQHLMSSGLHMHMCTHPCIYTNSQHEKKKWQPWRSHGRRELVAFSFLISQSLPKENYLPPLCPGVSTKSLSAWQR